MSVLNVKRIEYSVLILGAYVMLGRERSSGENNWTAHDPNRAFEYASDNEPYGFIA